MVWTAPTLGSTTEDLGQNFFLHRQLPNLGVRIFDLHLVRAVPGALLARDAINHPRARPALPLRDQVRVDRVPPRQHGQCLIAP